MEPSWSATETARAVRRREVSPVEVLEATLARVDALNPSLNAVVWRNDEQARADARKLADVVAQGLEELPPLAGVPVPVKDLTEVAGWPVTFGSLQAPEGLSDEDELVVARLRRAGCVLTGRTNTPEFGPITAAENLRYGISRNPWDTGRTPGGSSGGAAAAVASGMVPMAHANDGGGSIRIPASCCGLVGLKPSRGRVPQLTAVWLGASVEGVLTRTVLDTATALDLVSGNDPLFWFQAPPPDRPFVEEVGADPGSLRIALVTRAPLGLPVDEAPRAAAEHAGALLESLGHRVERLDIELFPDEAIEPFVALVNAGLGDYARYGIDFSQAEPHIAAAHRQATQTSAVDLVHHLGQLQRISRAAAGRFGRDFDLLVTPTMAIEPPEAGRILAASHANPEGPVLDVLAMAAFTAPFNVSGQPAVSVPLWWSDQGLPIGVQVVGGPFQEAVLLRVAAQLEQAEPWAGRWPPG